MQYKYNGHLKSRAFQLRNNLTPEERHLWYDCIKKLPLHFARQKIIGNYVVDFVCTKAMLIIELDGSQHYEEAGQAYDAERDNYLKEQGYTVLRYSNYDVNTNFNGVSEDIYNHIKDYL